MKFRFLFAACAVLVLAASAAAQQQQRAPRPFRADPLTVSADIMEASRLMAVNPDAAIALLHQLNARYPGRDDILSRLGYGMQVVGKADSAVFYYKAALQSNPMNLDAGKSLGSIYFTDGREREAMQLFNRILEANNYNIGAYKIVAGALRDLGRTDEAIDILEQGRKRNPKNQALTLEIATLYKQAGDNKKALDQYLDFVVAEPRSYRLVRARMIEVLRDADTGQDALVAYLNTRANKSGNDGFAAMDVLAAFYLESGLLENALDMALRADADKSSDGTTLLALAEDAMNRTATQPRPQRARYLDLGLRASEAYVHGHEKAPDIDRAKWILADIYTQYGSGMNPAVPATERAAYLERAVKEYEDISRRFPGSELAEQAYIERGDVLLKKLKRPDEALNAYKSGSVNARRLGGTFAARIAEVYIGDDRTADADNYLRALTRAGNPDLAQAGLYYTGVNLAVKKEYSLARDTLTALAELAPSSAYSNDAIETAWVIEEANMYKSQSLDDWFAARKADMVGDTTTMLVRYQSIGGRGLDDPVRPRALHEMGLLLFDRGSNDAAIAAFRRFLDDYPDNEMSPVVLRAIGRVYEVGLGQYERALHEYEQVLMSYPEYALLDDIRRDITRVRAMQQGATYAP
ncbi:MAG: tetratricopeptide repeat protein [Candidatus Krumholzibacteria bacterium]|nr:tetratricopeptide repeat protein [Candidatus Krumholzibacteria bacterium]MDH4337995.1 tetratricopeptide repeat protein [Candidatus Krumholzibacteria bacterium]MDH5270574.1 tetratricopeptide repeat protein [Candidatus Krumholzibacteria bacterium]